MSVLADFPPSDSPRPLTEQALASIESYYAIRYPDDLRALLRTYVPGSFDGYIDIVVRQSGRSTRTSHPIDGFYIIVADPQSEADELRDEWRAAGLHVRMPGSAASEGQVF